MIKWLRALVGVGIALGLAVTGLGRLAQWWPALDLVNNGLPALAAGAIVLCVLAVVTRDWRAIALAGLLAAINVGLIVAGLAGAAAEAGPDAKRFLRVASFNLWFENERLDEVDTFLNQTDADIVMLQEVTGEHLAALHKGLDARYPYSVGDFGIVIFSKYAIKADGRVDRAGYTESLRLLARWVELDVRGTAVEVVGVHCARPFHPLLQAQDVAALTQLVLTRTLPIVVAGDFNLTPWADRLKQFTRMTGLGRFNTFILTWPMRWRNDPVLPVVAIDNVFASREFAKIGVVGGARQGSDHRPIIADIALAPRPLAKD